jgi:hypothetical protein
MELSVMGIIAIILLIGIVKKNGNHAGGFRYHGRARRSHGASRCDQAGVPAAFPPTDNRISTSRAPARRR